MKLKTILLLSATMLALYSCKKEEDNNNGGNNGGNNNGSEWFITQNTLLIDGKPFTVTNNDADVFNVQGGTFVAGEQQFLNPNGRRPKITLFSPTGNNLFFQGLIIAAKELRTDKTWDFEYLPVDVQGNPGIPFLASFVNENLQGSVTVSSLTEDASNGFGVSAVEFTFDDFLVADRMMMQGTGTQGTNTQGTPTMSIFNGVLKMEFR